MRRKISAVLVIILSLLLFLGFELKGKKEYKVLEVIEGDKFYIDLNSNGKKDDDELFCLKNVETFPPKYSKDVQKYAKTFDITEDEALFLGEEAKKYTISKILGKKIILKNENELRCKKRGEKCLYSLAVVEFNGEDFAKTLIEEGFGAARQGDAFNPYFFLENPLKIKENAKLCNPKRCRKKSLTFSKNQSKQNFARKHMPLTKVYSESPALTIGNVAIFLNNPNSYKMPSNSCRTKACSILLQNIKDSKESIDFAIYGLDRQNEIFSALVDAKKRGVKIRGVVDSKADGTYVYADTKKLKENFNVISDMKNSNMHNKFFIFDNSRVFTGTMNITTTGSGGYNANTSVLINDIRVANVYGREFEQMYNGKFQGLKQDFSVQNLQLNSNAVLDIYFSPAGNPLNNAILPLIQRAKREIYVSIFYLTNKDIIEALIDAKRRGVDVRIIYDAVGANSMKEKVKYLRISKVPVKVENWGGKDHEKNMVIDGEYFITGSANFSNSGMKKNDENILVFRSPDIAGFYRKYFVNLYDSIGDKYLKTFVRAESFESGNSCYDGLDNNFDGKIDSRDAGCISR